MRWVSIVVQVLILGMAMYLYNLCKGKYMELVKDPKKKEDMQAFVARNGSWLKPTSLVLAILLAINIILSILNPI